MRNYLIYNGIRSKDYGVYIDGAGAFSAPSRDTEHITIPGKNGDVIIDNGRYSNRSLPYKAFIFRDAIRNIEAFRTAMLSVNQYARLEDTYHPDEYVIAQMEGGIDVEPSDSKEVMRFDINFSCYPQRWVKEGERPITLTQSGSIFSQYLTESKPLIRAYGVGNFSINGVTAAVTACAKYVDFDSELQDAYEGGASRNSDVIIGDFPVLSPGTNSIVLNGISKLVITPRWWKL